MKPTLIRLVLCAAVLAAGALNASSATCSVPADHPTIQSAVDDTACSTINVAPGVYNENVTINRSVTLNGAQVGQTFTARTAASADESVVRGANPTGSTPVFLINAPGVTIDGFTIQNAVTAGAATGIKINTAGSDAVVMNDIFAGITSPGGSADSSAQAVYLENGPDNVNISNNLISDITSPVSARGIWLGNRASTDPSDDVLIKGNSFTGIASTSGSASAVLVDNGAGLGGGARPQLLNNEISNVTGATSARGFDFQTNTGFSLIMSNSFTNLNAPDVAAIRYDYPTFFQTEIHSNNFNLPVTAYAIQLTPATVASAPVGNGINAACNWYGSPDGPGPVGPGHGARVSPFVFYAPWLIAPAPDGQCTGNNVPATEMDCKQGGWTRAVRADGSTFKNQGDCIQYVNTGK
jgi:hypothetical protein